MWSSGGDGIDRDSPDEAGPERRAEVDLGEQQICVDVLRAGALVAEGVEE